MPFGLIKVARDTRATKCALAATELRLSAAFPAT
jgi:hypothetical protein